MRKSCNHANNNLIEFILAILYRSQLDNVFRKAAYKERNSVSYLSVHVTDLVRMKNKHFIIS